MEQKNFEERLERFDLTPGQREKYLKVFNQMQNARTKLKEDLKELAKQVSFAGFVRHGMQKLALTDREISKGNATLCLVPVSCADNLVSMRKIDTFSPAPQMQSLGRITVFEPAEADAEPCLTTLDVLAQIPAEFADKVSAFCLHLEDKFALNGYNLLAQAYEYNVELFAK